jgi:hypothetical protein
MTNKVKPKNNRNGRGKNGINHKFSKCNLKRKRKNNREKSVM